MTHNKLKAIYAYMKWDWEKELARKSDYLSRKLDSNDCWECVQEMERRGDVIDFELFLSDQFINNNKEYMTEFIWGRNPTNFFNCFGSWLEQHQKEGV